jgi:hypothetical protein
MKTCDLIGSDLDQAVSACDGLILIDGGCAPPYSTNWFFGGEIIEREKININYVAEEFGSPAGVIAYINGVCQLFGPTPLIAAMRCFVASREAK